MSEYDTIDGSGSEIVDNVCPSLKQKAIIVMMILVFVMGFSIFGGVTEFGNYESDVEEIRKTRNSPAQIINEAVIG